VLHLAATSDSERADQPETQSTLKLSTGSFGCVQIMLAHSVMAVLRLAARTAERRRPESMVMIAMATSSSARYSFNLTPHHFFLLPCCLLYEGRW
jgi:hypothetical protein